MLDKISNLFKKTAAKKTTNLWVISSVTFSDETRTETGSGGFFWLNPSASKEDAVAAFEHEVNNFKGDDARIRLVHMSVPAHLDAPGVTDYLDDRLDEIEVHATALKQTDTFSGPVRA